MRRSLCVGIIAPFLILIAYSMKTIVLKVDVDTFRGTQKGVPRLLELFLSRGASASFLFSLGQDHTGRAIGKILGRAIGKKRACFSLREQYGVAPLLYGTLLPGVEIGKRCHEVLRSVEMAGFETGLMALNSYRWQKEAPQADAVWTQERLSEAAARFTELFGHPPQTHAASGWQMNRAVYRHEARMGFAYASDTRGKQPFWPIAEGEPIGCVQIPTTLPLLDELLGENGIMAETAHEPLLRLTAQDLPYGHVFTLHADREGLAWLPIMEKLLDGWLEQGYRLISLGELYGMLDTKTLPYHSVEMGSLTSSADLQAVQGAPYPA